MNKPQRLMGVDVSAGNIVTATDDISRGIADRNCALWPINQYFNKEYVRLKSIIDRRFQAHKLTRNEGKPFINMNHNTKDIMHKINKAIVEGGTNVILGEEGYPSKRSYLINKAMERREMYVGKRVERGIFSSKNDIFIQADPNEACNIIGKAVHEAFVDMIKGIKSYPRSLSIMKSAALISSKGGY
ncbi:MAG: hypothetical protein ACP5T2_02630 [Thermoprotei archaeon]